MINSKMKIILLGPFYPYRGGISDTNEELAERLIESGHCVNVINFKMLYPKFIFPGKTQFFQEKKEFNNIRNQRLINSLNFFSWNNVIKKINDFDAELLISSYWTPLISVCISYINSEVSKKIKKIGLIHNAKPHEKSYLNSFLLNRYLHSLDKYITFSLNVKKNIQELNSKIVGESIFLPTPNKYGYPIEKNKAKRKLGLSQKITYLMFFGLIRPYKGLDLLIKAFNKLKKNSKNIELLIVGENYESIIKYKNMSEFVKNTDSIRLINKFIDEKMVKYWFSAADLVVQPYTSSSQSGITSMAIHFEKIIVTTNVGGISEKIDHKKNGFVCKANYHDIANKINDALKSERKFLVRNISKTKKEMSWKNFIKVLLG